MSFLRKLAPLRLAKRAESRDCFGRLRSLAMTIDSRLRGNDRQFPKKPIILLTKHYLIRKIWIN